MANENETQAEESPRNNSGMIKTIIVVVFALVIEVGTIAVTMYLSGGPAEVEAQGLTPDEKAMQNKVVEVLIAKEKFYNRQSGHLLLYDTEIYITVRNRYFEEVSVIYEASKAALAVDIGTIVRQADPAYFNEPTYATLCRQIKAVLDRRFGTDEDGNSVVERVLIRKCIPYRADL